MYRLGHYGAAMLVYAPIGLFAFVAGGRELALLGGVIALALATLPDIDHRIPGVSHRGPTHTIWFALAVGVSVGALGSVFGSSQEPLAAVATALFGFAVGTLIICSHLAADALTPMGIMPFAPLRDTHYTYDVTRADNPVANAVLFALGIAVSAGALVLARTLTGG